MTQPNLKPWCRWHAKNKEYEGFACGSSMTHDFQCKFLKHGEWTKESILNGKPLRHPTTNEGGICQDFRPVGWED